MSKTEKNELDILLPESDITLGTETIVIKPFAFAKLPKIISILGSIGISVYELLKDENGIKFVDDNLVINDTLLVKLSEVVQNSFPEICELMSIYTNKPKEYFLNEDQGLNGEDGIILLISIIERNYSFFIKRLSPSLTQLRAKAKTEK